MQTSGEMRREIAKSYSVVGWVERSETHHLLHLREALMGIAALHPSYGTALYPPVIASAAKQSMVTSCAEIWIASLRSQ